MTEKSFFGAEEESGLKAFDIQINDCTQTHYIRKNRKGAENIYDSPITRVRNPPLQFTYKSPPDGDALLRMIDDQCIGSLRSSRDRAAILIAANAGDLLENDSHEASGSKKKKNNKMGNASKVCPATPCDNWTKTLENAQKTAKSQGSNKSIGINLIRVLSSKNKMEVNLLIAYVLAQLIGAALAVKFDNFLITKKW